MERVLLGGDEVKNNALIYILLIIIILLQVKITCELNDIATQLEISDSALTHRMDAIQDDIDALFERLQ